MEIEFHLLDLRYEGLRRRCPDQERRLLASLAQHGQQTPVVVVAAEGGRRVLVDGYKRVRALRALKADTVLATAWDLAEAEALLLAQLMRCASVTVARTPSFAREIRVANSRAWTDKRFGRSGWQSGRRAG
jgi:hypothetical protein